MAVQVTQDLTYVIADINNRVRTMESKYNLIGERLLIVNQNMIEEYKKIIKDMKIITSDLNEMKAEIAEIKSVIKNVVSELGLFAKKDEVKVIDKYLNLWSPMNFVTEDQLKKAVEEKFISMKQERD